MICVTDTSLLIHQTQVCSDIQSSSLKPVSKDCLQSPCPMPGLEDCYQLILSSILFHGLYSDFISQNSIVIYKGILISGDHGVGKTQIVFI